MKGNRAVGALIFLWEMFPLLRGKWPVPRTLLWRGSLLPLGCEAAPKPFNEVCQINPV
jgi:hypothetical protein